MERRWARPRRGPVATAQEAARKRRVVREVDRFVEDEQSPKKPHPSVPRLAARSINVVAAASSRSALSRKPRRARTPKRRPTLRSRKELKAAVAGGAAAAAAAAAAPSDDGDDDPYGDDEDFSDDDGDDRHPQPRGDGLNAQQRAARRAAAGQRRARKEEAAARMAPPSDDGVPERKPLTPRSARDVQRFRRKQKAQRKRALLKQKADAAALVARKQKQLDGLQRFAKVRRSRQVKAAKKKTPGKRGARRGARQRQQQEEQRRRAGANASAGAARTTVKPKVAKAPWQDDTSIDPATARVTRIALEPAAVDDDDAPLYPRLDASHYIERHAASVVVVEGEGEDSRLAAASAAEAAARRHQFVAARASPRQAQRTQPHAPTASTSSGGALLGLGSLAIASAESAATASSASPAVHSAAGLNFSVDIGEEGDEVFDAFKRASDAMIAQALSLEAGEDLVLDTSSTAHNALPQQREQLPPPTADPVSSTRDWTGLLTPRRWDDPPSREELLVAERESVREEVTEVAMINATSSTGGSIAAAAAQQAIPQPQQQQLVVACTAPIMREGTAYSIVDLLMMRAREEQLGHNPDAPVASADEEEEGESSFSSSSSSASDDESRGAGGVSMRSEGSDRWASPRGDKSPHRHHHHHHHHGDGKREEEDAGSREQWNGFWDDLFAIGTQPLPPPRSTATTMVATEVANSADRASPDSSSSSPNDVGGNASSSSSGEATAAAAAAVGSSKQNRIPASQLGQQFLAQFELMETLDDFERDIDHMSHGHEIGQLLAQEMDALDALEAKKLAEDQAALLVQLQEEYESQMVAASTQLEQELQTLLEERVQGAEAEAQAQQAHNFLLSVADLALSSAVAAQQHAEKCASRGAELAQKASDERDRRRITALVIKGGASQSQPATSSVVLQILESWEKRVPTGGAQSALSDMVNANAAPSADMQQAAALAQIELESAERDFRMQEAVVVMKREEGVLRPEAFAAQMQRLRLVHASTRAHIEQRLAAASARSFALKSLGLRPAVPIPIPVSVPSIPVPALMNVPDAAAVVGVDMSVQTTPRLGGGAQEALAKKEAQERKRVIDAAAFAAVAVPPVAIEPQTTTMPSPPFTPTVSPSTNVLSAPASLVASFGNGSYEDDFENMTASTIMDRTSEQPSRSSSMRITRDLSRRSPSPSLSPSRRSEVSEASYMEEDSRSVMSYSDDGDSQSIAEDPNLAGHSSHISNLSRTYGDDFEVSESVIAESPHASGGGARRTSLAQHGASISLDSGIAEAISDGVNSKDDEHSLMQSMRSVEDTWAMENAGGRHSAADDDDSSFSEVSEAGAAANTSPRTPHQRHEVTEEYSADFDASMDIVTPRNERSGRSRGAASFAEDQYLDEFSADLDLGATTESVRVAENVFVSETRKAERAATKRRAALAKKRKVAERLLRRKKELEREERLIAEEEAAVESLMSRALAFGSPAAAAAAGGGARRLPVPMLRTQSSGASTLSGGEQTPRYEDEFEDSVDPMSPTGSVVEAINGSFDAVEEEEGILSSSASSSSSSTGSRKGGSSAGTTSSARSAAPSTAIEDDDFMREIEVQLALRSERIQQLQKRLQLRQEQARKFRELEVRVLPSSLSRSPLVYFDSSSSSSSSFSHSLTNHTSLPHLLPPTTLAQMQEEQLAKEVASIEQPLLARGGAQTVPAAAAAHEAEPALRKASAESETAFGGMIRQSQEEQNAVTQEEEEEEKKAPARGASDNEAEASLASAADEEDYVKEDFHSSSATGGGEAADKEGEDDEPDVDALTNELLDRLVRELASDPLALRLRQ